MDNLKQLIEVVSRNKVRRIEIIGGPTNYSSNLQKLYDGIASGRLTDDEAAANFFYGDNDNKQLNYTRLKRRLRRRLYNTLFFIDVGQPGFNELQKAYYSGYKDFAALKILIGRGARKSVRPLAEKIIRKALKFEFTDLIVEVAKELRYHYGAIEGDAKKFKEYTRLLNEQFAVWKAELLAEEYYLDLAVNFVRSTATKLELEEDAKRYAAELLAFQGKYNTYKFITSAFAVYTLRYQIVNDYENTLKVCEEAVKLLEAKPEVAPKVAIFVFLLRKLACHIQLKNFERGKMIAEKCLTLVDEGTSNWFNAMDYYLMLLYHTGQLQEAYKIFLRAFRHPQFRYLFENISENWRIQEAFIHYFISIGKIQPEEADSHRKQTKFRIGRFLNEVPTYSKDKRGANITILILQILFLLHQEKYDVVVKRLEALKDYSHRYLRKGDTFRSNCFIKMLTQLPGAYFNRTGTIRKAKKYSERLKEVPLELARQSSELEIVPYETLWEYVLESLDEKFH